MSRQCLSKWKDRYDTLGEIGLADRSSAPLVSPSQIPATVITLISQLRTQRKLSARLIAIELAGRGHHVSQATVSRWLVRLGLNRRRDLVPDGSNNRQVAKIVARYPST